MTRSRTPWRLILEHLKEHPVRAILTVLSVAVAVFLFGALASVVTSLEAAVSQAATNRIIVQSRVSLFVAMPQDYLAKIRNVPGVAHVTPFNWFGGYFVEKKNMFAQFAIDPEVFFEQYARDLRVVEGPTGSGSDPGRAHEEAVAAFRADRRACVIGRGLTDRFGWKVGDTIPLTPSIYPEQNGGAWEFHVVGIYEPLRSNIDSSMMWFRFDYLDETVRAEKGEPAGIGCFSVNLEPDQPSEEVSESIDALFENGPQATMTSTESAFQASFVSMQGNLPLLFSSIGGAVFLAVLLSVTNTMLMSARQRIREAGILQALGFPRGALRRLLLGEALALTVSGALLGSGLAVLVAGGLQTGLSMMGFTGYALEPRTLLLGGGVALAVGVVAGLVSGSMVARTNPAAAFRSDV